MDIRKRKPLYAFVTVLLLVAARNAWAEDWPQFRGPTGQGHSTAKDVPLRWNESESIAWKVPIVGRGWSSPVVLGDQIWLTTAIETEGSLEELQQAVERVGAPVPNPYVAGTVTLKAICVDAETGEVYWSERLDGAFSASPVFANDRVYFFGENGTATVVQPGDSFRSVAENQIDGRIMATPAFVDRSIILRTDTHLCRIVMQEE